LWRTAGHAEAGRAEYADAGAGAAADTRDASATRDRAEAEQSVRLDPQVSFPETLNDQKAMRAASCMTRPLSCRVRWPNCVFSTTGFCVACGSPQVVCSSP